MLTQRNYFSRQWGEGRGSDLTGSYPPPAPPSSPWSSPLLFVITFTPPISMVSTPHPFSSPALQISKISSEEDLLALTELVEIVLLHHSSR